MRSSDAELADDADLASIVDRIAQLLSGGVPGQSLR